MPLAKLASSLKGILVNSPLLPFTNPIEHNKLNDEFIEFQLLDDGDIPISVWKDSLIRDYYRMDKIWAFLSTMKYNNRNA